MYISIKKVWINSANFPFFYFHSFLIRRGNFYIDGDYDLTCYFRHLKEFFSEAGISITKENKKDIDRIIHGIVSVEYKNCSAAWKEVKKRIADDKEAFVSELQKSLKV